MHPAIWVIDDGQSQNIITSNAPNGSGQESMLQPDILEKRCTSDKKLKLSGLIILHLPIDWLHASVMLTMVDDLHVPIFRNGFYWPIDKTSPSDRNKRSPKAIYADTRFIGTQDPECSKEE